MKLFGIISLKEIIEDFLVQNIAESVVDGSWSQLIN
jgi:hypothetical protein